MYLTTHSSNWPFMTCIWPFMAGHVPNHNPHSFSGRYHSHDDVNTHNSAYTFTFSHIHTCIHNAHTYVHTYIHRHTYIYTHMHTHTHTYIYKDIHTYIHHSHALTIVWRTGWKLRRSQRDACHTELRPPHRRRGRRSYFPAVTAQVYHKPYQHAFVKECKYGRAVLQLLWRS